MTVKELAKSKPEGPVGRAYKLAERAHAGQKRKTGEPYFNHVLAAAETIEQWHLDEATIVAALLHDVVEDTKITLDQVKKEFGDEVAFLVDGVTKLGRIKYRGAENKAENLKKMILALSQDLRVIFIKLADRLHNMRTLEALPPQKQKRIAMETDEIYASLAYRLGMQNLSGELRDLAFPYLHPKEYEWLKKNLADQYEAREEYLKTVRPTLESALKTRGIKPLVIDFRAKRYSSLYLKLLRHNLDIERIYDLVAMRIIVNDVTECYAVLGVIHELWPPLPGRIKDYVAMSKPNGYRSLHTTVIGPDNKPIEIQIRTQQMHDENENGIAAHWLYEQNRRTGKTTIPPGHIARELRWVQQLRNWQETYENPETDPQEFIQSMKIDFFKDRIFVITPKGDVLDLPAGATPIDFAYQIHSEVGDACVGAKVNNQFVALDRELQSGDLVEILTQKNKQPSPDWLKFAKTALARDHIRAASKRKEHTLRQRMPTKTELKIVVQDRVGLLKDVTSVIARSHINIVSLQTSRSPGSQFSSDRIECATTDRGKIEKLILKIKKVNGVKEISYRLI